ncbi:hypothetical protein BMJ19_29695 [Sinorhizobium medicae]|nr:hypothetical protein BMJ19_29695 [Sinorhizobium medicae]
MADEAVATGQSGLRAAFQVAKGTRGMDGEFLRLTRLPRHSFERVSHENTSSPGRREVQETYVADADIPALPRQGPS